MKKTVYNGCDTLDSAAAKALLGGKRLGLLTNTSGLLRDLTLSAPALQKQFSLCALFAPEHGLSAAAQDGCHEAAGSTDPTTGLPVYDLFSSGSARKTAEAALAALDAVAVDIQDIGIRFYTYQFAMLTAMRMCARHGVQLIVLDRVDPLGGVNVSGNLLEADCVSGVGAVVGQPVISGMTIGELALWFNAHLSIGADVSVLPCIDWERTMYFDDTDLLFVAPSPNMPTLDTAILYPGTCLFEGTNLSEGRGTTKPFEIFGAPWLSPERLIDAINTLPAEARAAFDGLVPRACSFTPMFGKYSGELCRGIQLHVRDRHAVDMFAAGLHLLSLIRALHPDRFAFRQNSQHIAQLVGTRRIFDPDFDAAAFLASQKEGIDAFRAERKKYLLY